MQTPNARPAKNARDAIDHIKSGGIAFVATYTRTTRIDAKCLAKFEEAGYTLLRDDADGCGIRMKSGRSSVYLFPGQLMLSR